MGGAMLGQTWNGRRYVRTRVKWGARWCVLIIILFSSFLEKSKKLVWERVSKNSEIFCICQAIWNAKGAAILSYEGSMHMCVCEKGNAYTHDQHVAFSHSSHALIPNRGNLQVSTTSEVWRALQSLLKVGEDNKNGSRTFRRISNFSERT